MARTRFLYAEIKVYPASVETESYSEYNDWDTVLIAEEPVLATSENIGIGCGLLHDAIENWINSEEELRVRSFYYKIVLRLQRNEMVDNNSRGNIPTLYIIP